MGKKRRHSAAAPAPSKPPVPMRLARRTILWMVAAAVVGSAMTATAVFVARPPASPAGDPAARAWALSLGDLLTMTPQQIGKHDIAAMNLLCAQGLPGAEKLDIPRSLAMLDQWAKRVRWETDRHLYRLHDPRYASRYGGSEGLLRMEMLSQVLQEEFGVRYNPQRVRNVDFRNGRDLFIHGMIGDGNGGTCVSMPVLYTAVARRLGYPVRLVEAKEHVFCRWDGAGPNGRHERFNIEAENETGT